MKCLKYKSQLFPLKAINIFQKEQHTLIIPHSASLSKT